MKPAVQRLMDGLRGSRVLVIHPRDREGDMLLDQLRRFGCEVVGLWPTPSVLPTNFDTVFLLIEADQSVTVPDERPTLIAIVDYENPTILRKALDVSAEGVVNKPLRAFGILSALVLARAQHGYVARLNAKVTKLEETLKARRDIDKAVKILMGLKKLEEPECYELLRQQATQRRLPMADVARGIIQAQEALGGFGLLGSE
ncbi:ANTAR domain-containing response regulator [Aureimonas sp. SK2]|uniref:ANTAR domain-containing response regulator n=1 Tax=Aureimonas sp. SK2 TaxID=3015992 RepID=UPI002444761C|nr:ANTAR domain-containing protein [Aureimonas sp. SK2]